MACGIILSSIKRTMDRIIDEVAWKNTAIQQIHTTPTKKQIPKDI